MARTRGLTLRGYTNQSLQGQQLATDAAGFV